MGRARYYPGAMPTLLIVVMILQLTLIRVDSNIIDLTLNIRRKVLLGLLSAGLSVGFAWVLVARFDLGISGLAAGFIAGRAIQSVTYPMMIGRILSIPTSAQVVALLRAGVVTAALFGGRRPEQGGRGRVVGGAGRRVGRVGGGPDRDRRVRGVVQVSVAGWWAALDA